MGDTHVELLVRENPATGNAKEISELYKNKSAMLSYSPDIIISEKREYILHSSLPSKLSLKEKFYVIENDMLGIVATGITEEEAEADFAKEFDFIYQRYNELSEDEMTVRVRRIRILINSIVKQVKNL